MITNWAQFFIIIAIVSLFLGTDLLMARRFDRLRTDGQQSHNWAYMTFVFIVIAALLSQPIIMPNLSFSTTKSWGLVIQGIGMLCAIGGLALYAWSRYHLGKWYAQRGEIQPNHQLITTGPYVAIRHPIFSSYFLIAFGILCINPSPINLAILSYAIWEFSRGAIRDEQILQEHFPEYRTYMDQTGQFWPRIRH